MMMIETPQFLEQCCRAEPKVSTDSVTEEEPARIVPKPRSNPFGSARPREEVLREKGCDSPHHAACNRAALCSDA